MIIENIYVNYAIYGIAIVGGAYLLGSLIAFLVRKQRAYLKKLREKRAKAEKQKAKVKKSAPKSMMIVNPDLTATKDMVKGKMYYEARPRDYFESRSFIKGYFERRKRRKNPYKIVLIRMEMNNGKHREFLACEDEKAGFLMDNKRYIFDLDMRYEIVDSNIFGYDYHEGLTLPIKRTIPVEQIKKSIEHSKITKVQTAINPATLEKFIKGEIAQGLLQGTAIARIFKVVLIMTIIIMIVIVIDLVIDLYSSGALDQIFKK